MNQAAIAKQLDDWQVLPKPERLSELYFNNAAPLPALTKPGAKQKLSFTVHNVEHRITLYRYKLLAVPGDGGAAQPLKNGTLMLSHGQSQDVELTVTLPSIGSRVAVKVELEYEAMKSEGVLATQKQSVHRWVQMAGVRP